jgi:hypothetical protein
MNICKQTHNDVTRYIAIKYFDNKPLQVIRDFYHNYIDEVILYDNAEISESDISDNKMQFLLDVRNYTATIPVADKRIIYNNCFERFLKEGKATLSYCPSFYIHDIKVFYIMTHIYVVDNKKRNQYLQNRIKEPYIFKIRIQINQMSQLLFEARCCHFPSEAFFQRWKRRAQSLNDDFYHEVYKRFAQVYKEFCNCEKPAEHAANFHMGV